MGNVHISNGQAATVTQIVKDILASHHVDEKKVVGFGSDSASVMTSENNGVAARLKRVNPFLISIHCMAHKLALYTSQASTGTQYLSTFKETFASLYRYLQITAMRTSDGKYLKGITSQLPPETVAGTRSCEVTFQGRSIKATGQQVKHFASIKSKFLENTLSNLELRFPSMPMTLWTAWLFLGCVALDLYQT